MTSSEINRRVSDDLKHIPRGATGSPQNLLRAVFWATRANSLSAGAGAPGEDLQRSIETVRGLHPGAAFRYDVAHFGR